MREALDLPSWIEPVAGQGRQRHPTDGISRALFLSAGDRLGSWTPALAPTRARELSLRPVGRRGFAVSEKT